MKGGRERKGGRGREREEGMEGGGAGERRDCRFPLLL